MAADAVSPSIDLAQVRRLKIVSGPIGASRVPRFTDRVFGDKYAIRATQFRYLQFDFSYHALQFCDHPY
jgi:hypothetical protein